MDMRLSALLPTALNIRNGDAKIIKNAGALIKHPFGSVMRILLICIYEPGVREIGAGNAGDHPKASARTGGDG